MPDAFLLLMVKAVLFDMDGLLVDTEGLCVSVVSDVLRRHFEKDVDASGAVGRRVADFFADFLNKHDSGLSIEYLESEYSAAYEGKLRKSVTPLPGAFALLSALKGAYPLGLVTGSSFKETEIVLSSLKIEGIFDVVVSSEDVSSGKPQPDPYLLAAQKLNKMPGDCLVLEDSQAGVKSAKAAGMFCIGVVGNPVVSQDLSDADIIVESLEDVDRRMINEI